MSVITEMMAGNFADISCFALRADAAACGHYRVEYPMRALREGGARAHVCESGFDLSTLKDFDVILAQRQFDPNVAELLLTAQQMGKVVLFEIDDNVHMVHRNSPVYNDFRPGSPAYEGVRKVMQLSDGLFTSSAELASYYAKWNKRAWVLPNQIDIGCRNWTEPQPRDERLQGKTVIGWAGSITHQDDHQAIAGVMQPILDRFPQAIFAIVSAHQTMDIFERALGIPEGRMVRLDPVPFVDYPPVLSQFDIGIVPVVKSPFNAGKSDLKILEYGAWGIPYVASKIAPYARLHVDTKGQGGYLCEGQQEWVEAISRLVEDYEDRRDKGDFMKQYVHTERSTRNNAWRWAEAIREAVALAKNAPEMERRFSVATRVGRNDPCPCRCGRKAKKCENHLCGAW